MPNEKLYLAKKNAVIVNNQSAQSSFYNSALSMNWMSICTSVLSKFFYYGFGRGGGGGLGQEIHYLFRIRKKKINNCGRPLN